MLATVVNENLVCSAVLGAHIPAQTKPFAWQSPQQLLCCGCGNARARGLMKPGAHAFSDFTVQQCFLRLSDALGA